MVAPPARLRSTGVTRSLRLSLLKTRESETSGAWALVMLTVSFFRSVGSYKKAESHVKFHHSKQAIEHNKARLRSQSRNQPIKTSLVNRIKKIKASEIRAVQQTSAYETPAQRSCIGCDVEIVSRESANLCDSEK